jgi:hypothetical protein
MTRTVLALLIALTVNAVSVNGQSLFNQPESVAYDEANDRYLVSNYGDGNIIAVDHNKNATLWYSGLLHAMGCEIAGNRLYVSVYGNRVIGINLTTKTTEWQINASSLQNLDGITWDGGNYLYVVDTYGRILKADIANQTYENFVTGLSPGIQDIVYDGVRNRLLIAAYYGGNSVLAVDLTSRAVTTAMQYAPANLDGICLGYDGRVFLSSHASGGNYMWDGEHGSTGTLVIASLNQPAGCCYNFVDGELAIAQFGNNAVAYLNFDDLDNDGLLRPFDNCPGTYNPDQADIDSDGLGNVCDNCPTVSNATQLDTDSDGLGNVCDPDDDNDGVPDASDIRSLNPLRCADADSDGCDDCAIGVDGFGPLPDNLPGNDGIDTDADGMCDTGDFDDDNDGVSDAFDSSPLDPLICADADNDGCDDCAIGLDGFGPLADKLPNNDGPDTDADGICNTGDNCPNVPNPGQEDSDGDNIGDVCDNCCSGRVGNANGLGTYPNEVTISDIQTLVTAKFIVGSCAALPCLAECDVNQSGGATPTCNDITISDIQTLVNHLFIAGPANAPLKSCL